MGIKYLSDIIDSQFVSHTERKIQNTVYITIDLNKSF